MEWGILDIECHLGELEVASILLCSLPCQRMDEHSKSIDDSIHGNQPPSSIFGLLLSGKMMLQPIPDSYHLELFFWEFLLFPKSSSSFAAFQYAIGIGRTCPVLNDTASVFNLILNGAVFSRFNLTSSLNTSL